MFGLSNLQMVMWLTFMIFIVAITLNEVLSYFVSKQVRQLYLQKFTFFWLGISAALICKSFIFEEGILEYVGNSDVLFPKFQSKPIKETWRLLPNGSLVFKSNTTVVTPYNEPGISSSLRRNDKIVIFITTTDYSVVQSAALTRLAQALYPVRRFVLWIVVSLPLESSFGASNEENNGFSFQDSLKRSPELREIHRQNLDNLLKRFDIPYVLLLSEKTGNMEGQSERFRNKERLAAGFHVGFTWAEQRLTDGVIFMGDEHYAYKSALFQELRKTNTLACWQIGLTTPKNKLIYAKLPNGKLKVAGYHDGTEKKLGVILLERSGFAVDLRFLRKSVSSSDFWRLTHVLGLTNDHLQIILDDIDLLTVGTEGINESEVDEGAFYVWKTKTVKSVWPAGIYVKSKIFKYVNFDSTNESNVLTRKDSNMPVLLKNAFGPRFKMMKTLIFDDGESQSRDYDLKKVVNKLL